MNDVKTCTKCQQSKPLGEFYRDKRARDGKQSQCRSCINWNTKFRYRKFCPACKNDKFRREFRQDTTTEDGHARTCKQCATEKPCSICKETKPIEEYGREKIATDGHKSHCKKCLSQVYKKPRSRKTCKKCGEVKLRHGHFAYQPSQSDGKAPICVTCQTEKTCTKCEETKPIEEFHSTKQNIGGLRQNCKKCTNEYSRHRIRNDPILRQKERQRSKIKSRIKRHQRNHLIALIVKQAGRCALCRQKLPINASEIHVDHNIPKHKGGPDTVDNLQASCKTCNLRKGAKSPEQWEMENGRLPLKYGTK